MAGGYIGKQLFVDLTNGRLNAETLDDSFCRKFYGGYGFGASVLSERMPAKVDALGPENMLGFISGPLTGTPALVGSRYVVVGKSPLTHTWGDANSGGYFGTALKHAGYDGVYFSGISEKPVYLLIQDGKAEIRDAAHLWGKDSHDTEDMLKEAYGKDANIACIGPAGESLSLIAAVMNDKGRAAGRSGVGALMGSRNLKAIVASGDIPIPLADRERTMQIRRDYLQKFDGFYSILHEHGTAGIMADSALSGDAPVKNWGGAGPVDYPNAKQISDDAVVAYQDKRFACTQCPIACGGLMSVPGGKYRLKEGHKPEYETLASFGSMTLNDDIESIIKLNEICNRAGLDTISAGSSIAFAVECFENSILTTADTDGIDLHWGNAEGVVAMTEKLAKREGLGDILADGVKVAAEKIGNGSEEFAIHIHGQEVPMHDPKHTPGLAPTYQLDATPARHTQGGELVQPPSGLDIGEHDREDYAGRAADQQKLVNMMHVVNATGLCMFGYISLDAQSIPDFMSSVTGWDVDMDECLETGERIGTLRHLFNLREGLNPREFKVPGRVLGNPPLEKGNVRGLTVDLDFMAKEYLELMDWDVETTQPSERRLRELGLADLA
jgi:aldehyde:ferredoxin oxidoreductase